MYNDPLTSYWRLPKVFKRMKLLMETYPYNFLEEKPIKFTATTDVTEIINYVLPQVINEFDNILFTGQVAYIIYTNPNKQINLNNINQIEIITDSPNEVGKFIKNLTYKWAENDTMFSVKFFDRFFSVLG